MDAVDGTTLRIAPGRLRLQAGLWDLAAFGVVELTPPVAVAVLHRKYGGQEAWTLQYLRSCSAERSWRSISRRGVRSYGSRRVGIRRIDAHTGGPINLRTVFALQISGAALSSAMTRPFRGALERNRLRLVQLQPEIKRLEETHPGDRRARQLAVMDLYRSRNVDPLRVCAPSSLRSR